MEVAMLDLQKYRHAILQLLRCGDGEHLGNTELLILLYYLDFDHFEQHDAPVTGDSYLKLPSGPAPAHADSVLRDMEREGLIRSATRGPACPGPCYTALVGADLSAFSPSEQAVLAAVCERWRHASPQAIAEASRQDAPWIAAADGDEMPYVYSYYRNQYHELETRDEEGGYLSPDDLVPIAE